MPFPGSQQSNTISFAYWMDQNIGWLRLALLAMIAYPVYRIFQQRGVWKKALLLLILGLYTAVFYFFNFKFLADKMFYQPTVKTFSDANANKIAGNKLVIGLSVNGQARAYPIQLIGYHHLLRDTVGNVPILVTYCTVCRTGRVFSPIINGKNEAFRLVGMDHFNAMFEDVTTKSWWRQSTGEAVAGPLKGMVLNEIPSSQSTLAAWLEIYPNSSVLQPDTFFNRQYKDLANYDNGTIKGSLEKRDSASWKFKSWVVGVSHGSDAKAYDWNELAKDRFIEDSLPGLPLMATIEQDTATFHVWNRSMDGKTLHFMKATDGVHLEDATTHSVWDATGLCVSGSLKGRQLEPIQAYQEFWHSWNMFHPKTLTFDYPKI